MAVVISKGKNADAYSDSNPSLPFGEQYSEGRQ